MTISENIAARRAAGGLNLRRFVPGWRGSVFALVSLILVYQVLVPFVMIVWTSLKTMRPGEPGFLDLSFSFDNYVTAFGNSTFWSATYDTLAFSLASTFVSFIFGAFIAWTVERTNTPLTRLIGAMLVARIVIPGILITISWILLASPNIGILNNIVRNIFGVRNFFNIYSFWGMVWIHAIEMVPLTYLLLAAAFKAMDPRLEEASIMTGAGTLRTMWRISMPLALPAIGAALLLLFITTIETFEVPLLIGGRAGVRVYTTEIFFNTSRTPINWGLSSAYSMAMLLMAVVLLAFYFRLVRHGERYQTITGKDFKPRRIDLGRWRYLTCAISLLLVVLITVIPFLIMLYVSFLPFYQPPSAAAFGTMSMVNYATLFKDDYIVKPMINSTILGVFTATFVVLFVTLISYFVNRTRFPGRKIMDFLAFASIAIPSVVLGAAFLWFYLLLPVPVIGTLSIIFLAYLTKYTPIALRFVSASMTQIHGELEEAAQVAGVSWWRNFFKILLPLLKPGLLGAWFWVMVHAYRELTVALMLARANNRTAAVIIYDLWEQGSFMRLSAFGVLMFLILMVLVLISNSLSRRYGIQEQH
jgi:iron(III) transport system permease protein